MNIVVLTLTLTLRLKERMLSLEIIKHKLYDIYYIKNDYLPARLKTKFLIIF